MSSKSGLITSDGLRVDGRRRDEVRRMNFLVRISPDAAGSAEVDVGGTRVQATVFGPAEVYFILIKCHWDPNKALSP